MASLLGNNGREKGIPLTNYLETLRCPLCQDDQYTVIIKADYPSNVGEEALLKFYSSSSDHQLMDQLVCCKTCTFYYLNPRIKSSIILESYKSAVDPTFIEQDPMRIHTFSRSLKKVLRRFHITPDRSKTVLDVGSAGGAFLKAATDLGFSGVGVEPSQWLCEAGRTTYGLDLRPGFLSDHSFPPQSFFMITLWDVLEHMTDPEPVLGSLHGLLKNNGYLLVNVPNYDSWARRLMQRKWPFFLSVHLSYFTDESLTRLLDRCGFRLIEITPHFQTLALGYAVKRAAGILPLIKPFEKLLNWIGLGRVPFVYNMGQSLFVAQKK